MKQLWFTTSFFSPRPDEEEKTNPGLFGEELATWVRSHLIATGYDITEEPIPEDWGWVVMVQRKPFPLWVGCGNEDGSLARWRVFVEAEPGLVQRLFKRIDTKPSANALERDLERLIHEASFESVEWEQM